MTLKKKYCDSMELNDLLRESFRNADAKVTELKTKNSLIEEEKYKLNVEFGRLKKRMGEIICKVDQLDANADDHNTVKRLKEYMQNLIESE
jgi:hypothetical protein